MRYSPQPANIDGGYKHIRDNLNVDDIEGAVPKMNFHVITLSFIKNACIVYWSKKGC